MPLGSCSLDRGDAALAGRSDQAKTTGERLRRRWYLICLRLLRGFNGGIHAQPRDCHEALLYTAHLGIHFAHGVNQLVWERGELSCMPAAAARDCRRWPELPSRPMMSESLSSTVTAGLWTAAM